MISECGFRISEWRYKYHPSEIRNPHSEIQNPHSEIDKKLTHEIFFNFT
jgi:hypothetical protein